MLDPLIHINVNGFLVKAGYYTVVIGVFIIKVEDTNIVSTVQLVKRSSIGAMIHIFRG